MRVIAKHNKFQSNATPAIFFGGRGHLKKVRFGTAGPAVFLQIQLGIHDRAGSICESTNRK
jgi:hypothetical protein